MNIQYLKKTKLPDSPGVYTFKDSNKRPLYIGRATSFKDRIKSYFSNDIIETRGPRIVDMVTKAKSISVQKTDSVLEAILLESSLIKKYQPFYNVDERDDKSDEYVVITEEEWPRVFQVRTRDFDQSLKERTLSYKVKKIFGPFPQSGLIKEALKILRRLFPFRDKKANDPRHEVFYRAIGRSPMGAKQYQKTINELILFFEGKKKQLKVKLQDEMKDYSDRMEFEEADRIKRLLFAMDHIHDIALLKRESNRILGSSSDKYRMEAYDIAHLSGTNVVGAMVVSIGGKLSQSEYRKFKISKQENNDIAALVEILGRRLNHSEWNYPDLIIVDGNEIHIKAAEAVLKARHINIPIVAVTKDDRHKAAKIIDLSKSIQWRKNEIVTLNLESHRFAIKYHRLRRSLTLK
jgi:excinuclease ABC subunit C